MLLCLRRTDNVSEYIPESDYDSENVKSFVEIAGSKERDKRTNALDMGIEKFPRHMGGPMSWRSREYVTKGLASVVYFCSAPHSSLSCGQASSVES